MRGVGQNTTHTTNLLGKDTCWRLNHGYNRWQQCEPGSRYFWGTAFTPHSFLGLAIDPAVATHALILSRGIWHERKSGFRIEQSTALYCPDPRASLAAIIPCPRSPTWHRRARRKRSFVRKRIKAASASGISPWLRDLIFLNCHHTQPYPSLALFMGKQGKWQAPPWQSGRQGKQQQQDGNSWSYWHGSWRSRPQKDTEDRKDGTIQFPDYNQIKIQEAQSSGLSSDQIMDVSEGEDVPGQDFVKFLQKLLNSARRADTKLRKIQ